MEKVIGVVFDNNKRVYYFSPNNLDLKENINVIVQTERGLQYGKTVTNILEKKKDSLNLPLKNVIRITSKDDYRKHKSNINDAKRAIVECEKLIKKYNLNIRLIDASFTFDREQLVYHFLSDSRIDFRNLVKDLASIFKTRIELRQVGVRDKAKDVGGIGPCGRTLCCSNYLVNFDTVSINMAKNQNLSLNPSKINGVCGRLLCCLTYENDVYDEYKKGLPNLGERVKYDGKTGKVVELNILKREYTIQTDDDDYLTICLDESIK